MVRKLKCFKAYDLRGKIPEELNAELAEKVGKAYASVIRPETVIIGHDIRLSSKELTESLMKGLTDQGVDVKFIGLCGTENIYFGTSFCNADGGIMVTASHNPGDYNGMKFVKKNSVPLSSDYDLPEMEKRIINNDFQKVRDIKGKIEEIDINDEYTDHLLTYVNTEQLKKLKIVCNPGNGCAGPFLKKIAERINCEFIYVNEVPDGNFPNGIPNPLLPENRGSTSEIIKKYGADLGIAWDGDFDRCFFFDEKGDFIEGYYIVSLLAESILRDNPGSKIIHDPRLYWNTVLRVEKAGGIPLLSKTGHAFIKRKMREEDAVYGGEMSAHHYFRDFFYCDSGMIPWLLVLEKLSSSDQSLSSMVNDMIDEFPVSGEINLKISDSEIVLKQVKEKYQKIAEKIDETDGLSMDMGRFRFNIRSSNTEPLLRINMETRNDSELLKKELRKLLDIIENQVWS